MYDSLFDHLSSIVLSCLEFDYDLIYIGKEKEIFDRFFCVNLKQSIRSGCEKDLLKKCKKIIVVDDFAPEVEIIKLWEYIRTNPHDLAVIFMNNQRKYLFYTDSPIKIIEHILPFALKNIEERNELKMTEDENILYLYTTDKEIRKELLTSKIDKALSDIEPQGKRLYLENLYLRGMLNATELKVNYLSERLKKADE